MMMNRQITMDVTDTTNQELVRGREMSASEAGVQTQMQELQAVPLTLEGYSVLHTMMRFRWAAWRKMPQSQKDEVVREATAALTEMESGGLSAMFSMLG